MAKAKAAPKAAPAPAPPAKEKAAPKTSKKTETFRAPYEGDVNLHMERFVAEKNIEKYEVTEISPPDNKDDYWQKVIEYE